MADSKQQLFSHEDKLLAQANNKYHSHEELEWVIYHQKPKFRKSKRNAVSIYI